MAYGSGGFRGGSSSGGRSGGFNRGGGGGFRPRRDFGGPREMTKIKCSDCGKEAEVPFKPRNDTPVYCKECYFKKKGITPRDNRSEEKSEEKTEKAEKKSEESDESEETEEEY